MDSRYQQQQQQQSSSSYMARPSYPQAGPPSDNSATSSVFNSSSSLHSLSSQSGGNSLAVPFTGAGAPASSPSAQHHNAQGNYFPLQQQQQASQQTNQNPNAGYIGQRGGGGGLPATAPFLQDFSLLAEAAKRAQMACLERDLGDCEL